MRACGSRRVKDVLSFAPPPPCLLLARHGPACPGHPGSRENGIAKGGAAAFFFFIAEIIGRPDRPGDDELFGELGRAVNAVYIMASRKHGTLYVGVTSELLNRAGQHREGAIEGFTRQYGVKRLVWYEWHDGIEAAIHREND